MFYLEKKIGGWNMFVWLQTKRRVGRYEYGIKSVIRKRNVFGSHWWVEIYNNHYSSSLNSWWYLNCAKFGMILRALPSKAMSFKRENVFMEDKLKNG